MIGCAKSFNSTIYSLMFSIFETKPKKTLEYMNPLAPIGGKNDQCHFGDWRVFFRGAQYMY